MNTLHRQSKFLKVFSYLSFIFACTPDSPETADTKTDTENTSGIDPSGESSTGTIIICTPNEGSCLEDTNILEQCNEDGTQLEQILCGPSKTCMSDQCVGECDLITQNPSSIGCSFITHRMWHPESGLVTDEYPELRPDGLVVGNINEEREAKVRLLFYPSPFSSVELESVTLAPLEATVFHLEEIIHIWPFGVRQGGVYRVESDLPVVAYQHSPIGELVVNDSSMLLPEHALGQEYVVASYPPQAGASYFNAIAIQDNTQVEWIGSVDTEPKLPTFPGYPKGATGSLKINQFTTLQVESSSALNLSEQDLSGTIVRANKPFLAMGATFCAFIPVNIWACDHLQELLLPVSYWGREYVAAHAPIRFQEKHYWRIFAGEDNVTVKLVPPLGENGEISQVNLAKKGSWVEVVAMNGKSSVLTSEHKFMAVQYLVGAQADAGGKGDPSMVQMVPVEQFLDRYVFVTGVGYDENYVQITRRAMGADVYVDEELVFGYEVVGDFEVVDWPIDEGAHLVTSEEPFGIVNYGYAPFASYAYPGGMKLEIISSG